MLRPIPRAEEQITDLEIVERVRSGDREAYAELMRRHYAGVRSLCLSLLGSRGAQAEDAAQDVFVKAYQALGRFEGRSSFSTWIYRIASNHCLDLLRRAAREKTESLDALLDAEGERLRRLALSQPDQADSLEAADLAQRVLQSLAPAHRLALTLREVQGLSYEEIAQALECSVDAVKGRLKRARQELVKILRHFPRAGSVSSPEPS